MRDFNNKQEVDIVQLYLLLFLGLLIAYTMINIDIRRSNGDIQQFLVKIGFIVVAGSLGLSGFILIILLSERKIRISKAIYERRIQVFQGIIFALSTIMLIIMIFIALSITLMVVSFHY